MKRICKFGDQRIIVNPRWPYRAVYISNEVYGALVRAQERLSSHQIKLILTRGYENQGNVLRILHSFARKIGAILFCSIYPKRRSEVGEIFSPNGHDISGDSIDVGFMHNEKIVSLLPCGVFTNESTINRLRQTYGNVLNFFLRN